MDCAAAHSPSTSRWPLVQTGVPLGFPRADAPMSETRSTLPARLFGFAAADARPASPVPTNRLPSEPNMIRPVLPDLPFGMPVSTGVTGPVSVKSTIRLSVRVVM